MTPPQLMVADHDTRRVSPNAANREKHPPGGPRRATVNINEGRTPGRQWALLLATSGQSHGRPRAGSHGRCQSCFCWNQSSTSVAVKASPAIAPLMIAAQMAGREPPSQNPVVHPVASVSRKFMG
jgi:hypothetical protein